MPDHLLPTATSTYETIERSRTYIIYWQTDLRKHSKSKPITSHSQNHSQERLPSAPARAMLSSPRKSRRARFRRYHALGSDRISDSRRMSYLKDALPMSQMAREKTNIFRASSFVSRRFLWKKVRLKQNYASTVQSYDVGVWRDTTESVTSEVTETEYNEFQHTKHNGLGKLLECGRNHSNLPLMYWKQWIILYKPICQSMETIDPFSNRLKHSTSHPLAQSVTQSAKAQVQPLVIPKKICTHQKIGPPWI